MSTDTVKAWIEERQAFQKNRYVDHNAWSDATRDAIMEFPYALDALNRVLEQVDRMEADANTYGDGGHDLACDALFAYVVTLREAIEGAINGECK